MGHQTSKCDMSNGCHSGFVDLRRKKVTEVEYDIKEAEKVVREDQCSYLSC